METTRLLAFSEDLSREGVLLSFNGPFSHTLIEEFGRAIRSYLTGGPTNKATADVFSVYVEQAQNIQRYLTHRFGEHIHGPDDRRHNGIVVIARAGEGFAVSSGNRIAREDIEPLRARLESIRGADKAALKAMYKAQLRAEAPSHSSADGRGAGLGFISMARVSSAPIEFSMQELEDGDCFFSLRVLI